MCPTEPASGQIPSTSTVPEAKFDCHLPDVPFISTYLSQVFQARRHFEQQAYKKLELHTATAYLAQTVAIAGVDIVGVGLVGIRHVYSVNAP